MFEAKRSSIPASWEYLMPKRKERMAGYIRESDPSLADSTTIESAAKAVREYGERQGYLYDNSAHEYKEAISAYKVPYMERKRLLDLLAAAKRHEFDVLVVTEIRAISRRQVEVFIIYDILQRYGIRLETTKEKFEDDAMGRIILSLRAGFAEIEREQTYFRTQRGRRDRIEIGKAPNIHPKPAYGYILVNSEREVKGRYELNHTIVYVDADGKEWSEVAVVIFIFGLIKRGSSIWEVVRTLNRMSIPTPTGKTRKKELSPHWQRGSVYTILTNTIYTGEVWANRYETVKNERTNKAKHVLRPRSEWIRLPDAPVIISKEEFAAVQKQLQINKEDSLRNNKQEEKGLLRSGYIFCGICKRRMRVVYPSPNASGRKQGYPTYYCSQHTQDTAGVTKHKTQIGVRMLDCQVYETIREILLDPFWVRSRIEELCRQEESTVISTEDVKATIATIRRSMQNLYRLAEHAEDDETIANLTHRMNELERQKREVEAQLYDIADKEEEREALEAELVKFEQWAVQVRPQLSDGTYVASYEELRLAVRILGLRVTVYPTSGAWPFRYRIDLTIPEIMKKAGLRQVLVAVQFSPVGRLEEIRVYPSAIVAT